MKNNFSQFKKNFEKIKNINNSIFNLLQNGLKFCFILTLLSSFILSIYHTILNPYIFYIGISLFKTSLFYIAFFIICAIAMDKIVKEI